MVYIRYNSTRENGINTLSFRLINIRTTYAMVLGDLHINFGSYIQKYYGDDAWSHALESAGQDGSNWLTSCPYADSIFERYVRLSNKSRLLILIGPIYIYGTV